jgi:uroporphyrinogen decarboxylase
MMTSRELVKKIAEHRNSGANAFWTGHPSQGALKNYLPALNLRSAEELFTHLKDDCRWLSCDSGYRHPQGRPMFDVLRGEKRTSLSQPGCFTDATMSDIVNFEWPDPDHFDFTEVIARIRRQEGLSVFSGSWSMFFHVMCDFFGMEEYFVKMYTEPEVVEAATRCVVDFYAEVNDRFLTQAGDSFDIVFMGNDFGTQRDLLISPDAFKAFVLPGFKKIISVAKKHGKKVMLHSCGSIYKVIPDLIDAGVDILHPLQALAENMDAEKLSSEFKNDLAFCGGVDTQNKLVNYTPSQIREEVLRLRSLFGPNYIVSPSHEELLSNIPLENVIAMAEAAKE